MTILQDSFLPVVFREDHDIGYGPFVESHCDSEAFHSAHIVSCFLELEKLNQELKGKLRNDFISILNGVENISLSSTSQTTSPSTTPPSRSSSLIHDNSFVTEAYSWLLDNIANPYPSSAVKTSLSQRYNCTLFRVSSWFVKARRQMGWTALCRDHFNNCRADALDAAHRAFVKEDPRRPLPADIMHAFVSVKVAAEDLYSSILPKSAVVSNQDVVKDISNRECVEQERSESAETMEPPKALGQDVQSGQYRYPFNHSPSLSVPELVESITDESEDDEDISPPTLAGRKRRLSFSVSLPASKPATRVVKRLRLNSSLANAHVPFSATDADESSGIDAILRPASFTWHSTTSKTRKEFGDVAPEGPQDSAVAPPFVVSDSLRLSTVAGEQSMDEWFRANFDTLFTLPPPVDVTEPDFSTQWEVELFNKYILPEYPRVVPPIPDCRLSSSTDLTGFDDLLKSFGGGDFVAPPEIMHPPILPPQISPNLSQSIDWTSLLNDSSEPTSDSIFSQPCLDSLLPGIDVSFLQLPHLWTAVSS